MGNAKHVSRGELLFAIAVGSIALLVLGLQPLLLGQLLEAKRVSLEGVGVVAMAEIVALGAGVLLGDLLLPLRRLRLATALAAIAAAALDMQTVSVSGDLAVGLVRAGAGLAEGVLVWSTTTVIVRSAMPERMAGVFFVVQTLAQSLVGLLLARVIVPVHGWPGAFTLLAALALAVVALSRGLPGEPAPLAATATGGFAWTLRTALPLLVVFLQLSTLGAFWAYVEPLGLDAGFTPVAVETLIAAGLAMQVVGGTFGTALVRRLPVRATLVACCAVLGLAALAIAATTKGETLAFAILCGAFTFTWLFMLPFQMGLAFGTDSSGRLASLVPAAQLFGSAFGPLVASFAVTGEQAGPVPYVAAGFAALAALALASARPRPA